MGGRLLTARLKAMVPAFVKAGIKGIVLMATNASKLADTEKSIKEANPNVETLSCALDVSDTKAVESAFEKIKAKFGHADVLVNAAGAMSGDGPKLHETDPEAWWRNFVRSPDPRCARNIATKVGRELTRFCSRRSTERETIF